MADNSALELFGRLPEADVSRLFAMGPECAFDTGDVLIVAGETPKALYIVLGGALAAMTATERHEVVATMRAGEVIGELALLDGAPASMTVAALERSNLLALPLAELRREVEDDPAFGMRFHRALGAMVSARLRRRETARQSADTALAPDPIARERAARVAAANIARLRGRQNHPSLLLENREDYASIITDGLAQTSRPAMIAVVGAGLAGLSAAYELRRAGHDVVVLEASRRAGGRCYTLREPFAARSLRRGGCDAVPVVAPAAVHVPPSVRHPDPRVHRAQSRRDFRVRRRAPADGGGVRRSDLGAESRAEAVDDSIDPLLRRYRTVAEQGGNAWPALVEQLNELTLRDFLVDCGWAEEDIASLGLAGLGMGGYGALMNMGFLELFRLSLLGTDDDLHEIVGGADELPRALVERPPKPDTPALGETIRFGSKLRALRQDADSVTLTVETGAGIENVCADYALITVPFPLLRFVDAAPRFSTGKVRAINELHYFSSTKIFLQFRTRFWEQPPDRCAGMVVSDLPIRALYLPQPDDGVGDGRGVVLASYTWESEARVWEALGPDDRVKESLRQVSQIFPAATREFEVGASVTWNDPSLFTGGAFAQYAPGQRGVLYSHIVAPEGRVHFAGEHTSFEHGWMEGAIESGLREALALHARAGGEGRS